jgi:hypothetical protein
MQNSVPLSPAAAKNSNEDYIKLLIDCSACVVQGFMTREQAIAALNDFTKTRNAQAARYQIQ